MVFFFLFLFFLILNEACGTSGALYALIMSLTGCQWIYSCMYRSKLRAEYNLPESPCCDCCIHFCCEPCALCQQHRELTNRGFDVALGLSPSLMPLYVWAKLGKANEHILDHKQSTVFWALMLYFIKYKLKDLSFWNGGINCNVFMKSLINLEWFSFALSKPNTNSRSKLW